MSFNGSGTFLINTAGQPVVAGTVISSTAFNALTADLATGLSTAITKDGQTTVTANIPMSTYKFTGLGVGSAAGDSANLSQVQSTVTKLLTSVSGTDTITAVGAPVVAAYAAGQMFYFVATGDNTGAVTLNIDSLGAKAVTRDGSVALVAGDIKSGEVVVVVYDGTRFQVVSQLNSAGDARFANVSITSALNVGGVATFSAGTAAAPSITTTGDTNTGIFFPAADTIAFTEGGVEAARFDSSGNLGIGTSSPTFGSGDGLEIQRAGIATLRLENSSASNSFELYADTAANGINLRGRDSSPLVFWTANTERMRLDSSGNLGIGTSSPITKLDVRSDAAVVATSGYSSLHFNALPASATARAATIRKNYDSPFDFNIYASTGTSGNSAATIFYRDITNESMRLDSSGNLGIGTSSPGERLDVVGGGLGVGNGTIKTVVSYTTEGIVGTTSNHALLLYANNAERARITSGGNLLVGTTSDNGYHRFVKSNTSDWICTFTNSSATTPWGISVGYSAAAPNNTNSGISLSDTGGERATIRNNGGLANYSANNVNLSDERTKKNIVPLGSMWDKFKAIEIVKFKYRDQTHDDDNIGVIAQQVESVAPEFVDIDGFGETPEDGVPFKTVYTTDMYHAAIKALQEAMARIEQLEAKFAALETK
jgi:hypothetical protein